MKNIALFLTPFFFLISSCTLNNSSIKNDLTKENLKGNVKLTVEEFESESNKSTIIKEFNEDGYLLREFESNNLSSSLIEYYYEENKLINRNSITSDGETKSTEKTLYEYSDDGKLIKKTIINDNKQRTVEYVYNEDRLIKVIQDKNTITNYYYSDYLDSTKTEHLPSMVDGEEYIMIIVDCYNDKEQLVKEIIRNYHNNKCDSFALLNKYNLEGNITSRVIEGKTDSLLISYTYDSKRNWVLQKNLRDNKIEGITTRKVFYSVDGISNHLKIIDDFKSSLSKVNYNKNLEKNQSTQNDNSVEVGGSFNQNNSDNQPSSSNQYRKCSDCNGTGKCRECSKTFSVYFYDDRVNSFKNRNESRLGYVTCGVCRGAGVLYKRSDYPNLGKWEVEKKCYVSLCRDGWVPCNTCKYSSYSGELGVCKRCKGTGSN